MDINLVFRYATIYFLLTGIIAIPLLGISWLTRSWIVAALLGLTTTVLSPMIITRVKEKLTTAVDYLPPFKKYAGRLARLHRLEEDILDAQSVQECCRLTAESFMEYFGLDAANIFLWDAARGIYEPQAALGPGDGLHPDLSADNPLIHRLQAERKIFIREMFEQGKRDADRAIAERMKSLGAQVSVPVTIRSRLVSVINAGAKAGGEMYNDLDLADMTRLARTHGQTLRSLHLELEKRQAEDKAARDPLTGLFNRGKIKEHLGESLERARESGGALALLLLDIDHFKKVNDTFGHPAGDEVIKALAGLLAVYCGSNGNSGHAAGRLGGEEFVMVLGGAGKKESAAVADWLLNEARKAKVPVASGREIEFTVSIGVASFPEDGSSSIDLIRVADERMYCAKQSGRNRVVTA